MCSDQLRRLRDPPVASQLFLFLFSFLGGPFAHRIQIEFIDTHSKHGSWTDTGDGCRDAGAELQSRHCDGRTTRQQRADRRTTDGRVTGLAAVTPRRGREGPTCRQRTARQMNGTSAQMVDVATRGCLGHVLVRQRRRMDGGRLTALPLARRCPPLPLPLLLPLSGLQQESAG